MSENFMKKFKPLIIIIIIFLYFPALAVFAGDPDKRSKNISQTGKSGNDGEKRAVSLILNIPMGSALFAETPVASVDGEPILIKNIN